MEDNNPIFEHENEIAKYSPYDNFIYIKESTIGEYETGNYRSSFTLAHEFFHFLQYKILEFDFINVEQCKPFEDAEWQANEFAGQLLIPSVFLDLKDEELSEKFHVSIECAATRKLYSQKRINLKKGGIHDYK